MVFSSNEFLFLYLPLSLIFYFFAPFKWRNLFLFLLSAIFYAWEKPAYLLIMLFVIVVNYILGYLIEKARNNLKERKRVLVIGVVINIVILCFFKYSDFLIINFSRVLNLSFVNPLGISLPIGISFYIFQSMSYIIDVYRGNVAVQTSFVKFGTYVSMFPQLIAGPIVRYSDVERELDNRQYTISESADGVRRFVIGLAKKVLLADVSGEMWEQIKDIPREQVSVLLLWLGIIFYAFQIYFDFSGYSDMAIGLGKMLGFHFPENFDYPYISKSITEFWRRWHITLSTWFKEYVYIPLGGNRCGANRVILNLLVVWLLTGLWHGASWNFVLWGLYYFILLVLEKFIFSKWLEKLPSAFSHLYTLLFVLIGWLIFYFKPAVGGFESLLLYFGGMFGFLSLPLVNKELGYALVRNFLFLVMLCVGCTPYPKKIFLNLKEKAGLKNIKFVCDLAFDVVLLMVFVLCVAYVTSSDYRPNIYFEF